MSPAPPLILPYGRRSNLRRHSFHILLLLVAVALALVARQVGTPVMQWCRLKIDFWRCERHSQSPDEVVFDSSKGSLSALFALLEDDDDPSHRWMFLANSPSATQPSIASSAAAAPTYPIPRYWSELYQASPTAQGPFRRNHPLKFPLLFLHHRRSAGGTDRLLAVSLGNGSQGPAHVLRVTVCSMDRAGRSDEVALGFDPYPNDMLSLYERFDPDKIFAGQPDPSDSAHFTIGYEMSNVRGTIDGRLMDDGSVWIGVRDGPANAMHDAWAAVKEHPETIANHVNFLDLAHDRGWAEPGLYEDLVHHYRQTRKAKLWTLLLMERWRFDSSRVSEAVNAYLQAAHEMERAADEELDKLNSDERKLGAAAVKQLRR